jgi:hypothetical protein
MNRTWNSHTLVHKPAQNLNFRLTGKKASAGSARLRLEPAYFHCLAPPLSILSPSSPAPGALALIDLCRADFQTLTLTSASGLYLKGGDVNRRIRRKRDRFQSGLMPGLQPTDCNCNSFKRHKASAFKAANASVQAPCAQTRTANQQVGCPLWLCPHVPTRGLMPIFPHVALPIFPHVALPILPHMGDHSRFTFGL